MRDNTDAEKLGNSIKQLVRNGMTACAAADALIPTPRDYKSKQPSRPPSVSVGNGSPPGKAPQEPPEQYAEYMD